jgi:hypothetical protein
MGLDGHTFINDNSETFTDFFDWVITGRRIQKRKLIPKTVFIKTDYLNEVTRQGFNNNYQEILSIQTPFILISGACDCAPSIRFKVKYETLINKPNLLAWYSENNVSDHPKMHGLPVGLCIHNKPQQYINNGMLLEMRQDTRYFKERSPIIMAHWRKRVHNVCGNEYNEREKLGQIVQKHPDIFFFTEENYPTKDYYQKIQEHQFIICPNGNGMDPAPRAWEVMILKVIPIIKTNIHVVDVYKDLPCIILDDWEQIFDRSFLIEQQTRIEKIFETDDYLYKLSVAHWIDKIMISVPP